MKSGLYKTAGALGLPMFLLAATVLFRWDEGQGAVEPPRPPAECAAPVAEHIDLPEGLLSNELFVGDAHGDSSLPSQPPSGIAVQDQARHLLYALRSAVDNGENIYPQEELASITSLIDRAPETAEVFLDAVAGSSPLVKAWLKLAFFKAADPALRDDLLARHRDCDPVPARIEELLADKGMVLATLRYPGEPEVRHGLINRLGAALLEDSQVMDALVQLAERDGDPEVRSRALARIGRLDRPEVKTLLLRTLRDSSKDLTDRQTAARMLCRHPDEATTAEFISILERGAEPPILRFAAKGLGKAAEHDRGAREALTDLLSDTNADLGARKNAASSLANSLYAVNEGERDEIGMQVLGRFKDLVAREDDASLLVHTFKEVGHSRITDRLGDELLHILNAEFPQELRQELLDDRRLMRILETHR